MIIHLLFFYFGSFMVFGSNFLWVFMKPICLCFGGLRGIYCFGEINKNMFMLLLLPMLNSTFLVFVSLWVQLSYTTFSSNFHSLIKYGWMKLKALLVYLLSNLNNKAKNNMMWMIWSYISSCFIETNRASFLESSNLGFKLMCEMTFMFLFYFLSCFIGLFLIFFNYMFWSMSTFYFKATMSSSKERSARHAFSGGSVSFNWDVFKMKVLMKMGVVIFLLLMMSYMSVFGYFMFGIWMDYISMMCVAPFFPSSLAGTVGLFNWLMSIVVITMSSLVLMTSMDYLDMLYTMYFLCLLNLFQLFMLGFVLTDSMMIMYVDWDWLGLMSYLLINLYFNSQKNGLKAIIFNKLGDIIFLIVIAYFIYHFLPLMNFFPSGLSLNLVSNIFILILSSLFFSSLVQSPVEYMGSLAGVSEAWNLWMMSLGLLVVFFTKSAQLPFSSWLINAMAAPTPVSSLLHSSTMVMIGVFLCLLLSPTLHVSMDLFNFMNTLFLNLCGFTLLWSLFKAFSSLNMKSIIAYSTVNQLSYMFLAFKICSLIVLFHIAVHAVFKSMLFLMAGSLIHTSFNFQNIFSHQLTFFSSSPSALSFAKARKPLSWQRAIVVYLFYLFFFFLFWIKLCVSSVVENFHQLFPFWGNIFFKLRTSLMTMFMFMFKLFVDFCSWIFNNKKMNEMINGYMSILFFLRESFKVLTRNSKSNMKKPKLLYISFLMGSFMLAFALSKELIMMGLMNIVSSSFLFFIVLIGALGTITYSLMLIYFIFFSTKFSSDELEWNNDCSWNNKCKCMSNLIILLIFLAFLCLFHFSYTLFNEWYAKGMHMCENMVIVFCYFLLVCKYVIPILMIMYFIFCMFPRLYKYFFSFSTIFLCLYDFFGKMNKVNNLWRKYSLSLLLFFMFWLGNTASTNNSMFDSCSFTFIVHLSKEFNYLFIFLAFLCFFHFSLYNECSSTFNWFCVSMLLVSLISLISFTSVPEFSWISMFLSWNSLSISNTFTFMYPSSMGHIIGVDMERLMGLNPESGFLSSTYITTLQNSSGTLIESNYFHSLHEFEEKVLEYNGLGYTHLNSHSEAFGPPGGFVLYSNWEGNPKRPSGWDKWIIGGAVIIGIGIGIGVLSGGIPSKVPMFSVSVLNTFFNNFSWSLFSCERLFDFLLLVLHWEWVKQFSKNMVNFINFSLCMIIDLNLVSLFDSTFISSASQATIFSDLLEKNIIISLLFLFNFIDIEMFKLLLSGELDPFCKSSIELLLHLAGLSSILGSWFTKVSGFPLSMSLISLLLSMSLSILFLLSFKLLVFLSLLLNTSTSGIIEFTIVIIMVYQLAIVILFLVNSSIFRHYSNINWMTKYSQSHLINLYWLYVWVFARLPRSSKGSRMYSENASSLGHDYIRHILLLSKGLNSDVSKFDSFSPNRYYVDWYFFGLSVFSSKFSTSDDAISHINYCVGLGFKGYDGYL